MIDFGHVPDAQPVTVYAYFDRRGACLYVGQTWDIQTRHGAHRQRSPWFADATQCLEMSVHDSRGLALEAEANLIQALTPLHNVRHNATRSAA